MTTSFVMFSFGFFTLHFEKVVCKKQIPYIKLLMNCCSIDNKKSFVFTFDTKNVQLLIFLFPNPETFLFMEFVL